MIYSRATGTTCRLALSVQEGAETRELAPAVAIAWNEGWTDHVRETHDLLEATNDALEWAGAIVVGTPTRFGLPTAQQKQIIEATGRLRARGAPTNKPVSSFASAGTGHGGQESKIVALNTIADH